MRTRPNNSGCSSWGIRPRIFGVSLMSASATLGRSVAGAIELTRGDRLDQLRAGDQPAARALHPPPLPQQVEEVGREHREAVLAPLALLDPDQHAGAVDVCDFEVGDLGDAQAAAVGDAEGCTVLQAWRVSEQERDLLGTDTNPH